MPNQKRPITIADLYQITYIEDPRVSPGGQWIAYVNVTVNKFENRYDRNIWLAPTGGGQPVQITRSGKDSSPRWSPDGSSLAFTSRRKKKPQIYLLPIAAPGGEARPLTNMPNGATTPAWSPDGTQIAFLSQINTGERQREDRDAPETPPKDLLEKTQRQERHEHDEKKRLDPYPMPRIPYRTGTGYLGDHFSQIYLVSIAEQPNGKPAKPRRLTGADENHSPPVWLPGGQTLITTRAARPGEDDPWLMQRLIQIDVESGETTILNDDPDFSDAMPWPSPDGKWIAFRRRRINEPTHKLFRLAIIPVEGGPIRELNLEFDRELIDWKWTPDSSSLIAAGESWGDIEIYRLPIDGVQVEKLIAGTMQVQALDVGHDGGIAYVTTTPTSPPELYWQPARADTATQLTHANTDFLAEVVVQPTHEIRYTNPDGLELQGWYILPVGYEEGKTYPLAFNIHGGPHAMWGPATRTMFHEWQCHAASGYVVFYTNPRGACGYGGAFTAALQNQWGNAAFADLMAGVDAVIEKGFVDVDRMAVTGGSYGGYMTAWVTGHTDRFKAAVAQRGVYNLSSFYGTTDIPYLITHEYGTHPWQDHQRLWEHSPLAYAHQIKTPLLLIHAENDFRVSIEQAEQLYTFVRRSGGTVHMLRYPRDGHELSRSGEPEHRISRLTEMIAWFDRYCQIAEEA